MVCANKGSYTSPNSESPSFRPVFWVIHSERLLDHLLVLSPTEPAVHFIRHAGRDRLGLREVAIGDRGPDVLQSA